MDLISQDYGLLNGSCMFCPNDIRRKYGNKIINMFSDDQKTYTEYLGKIQYAQSESDIPSEIKNMVLDQPDLQLYIDEDIEVAIAARKTKNTHILISPVKHIEVFESQEELMVLSNIFKAAWAIMNVSTLPEATFGISLKSTKAPIPHVHFHLNCDSIIDELAVKKLLEERYFYNVSTI